MKTEIVNFRQKGEPACVTLIGDRERGGYYGEGSQFAVNSVEEAENEVQERLADIRQDPPMPLATIGPKRCYGPYGLVDGHGEWKQSFSFQSPVAARLFIRTLRASGSCGETADGK
jgi:hypothetical protein